MVRALAAGLGAWAITAATSAAVPLVGKAWRMGGSLSTMARGAIGAAAFACLWAAAPAAAAHLFPIAELSAALAVVEAVTQGASSANHLGGHSTASITLP